MARPKPAPKQVWRSKKYSTDQTCLHIEEMQNDGCVCRIYKGTKLDGTAIVSIRSLLHGYQLITYHWSGENLQFLKNADGWRGF